MTISDEASRLSQLAREHLGEDLGRRWSALLESGARLKARPEGAAGGWLRRRRSGGTRSVGWLGDVPTLPAGAGWPVWDEHGPLSHVATLDCGQLYPSVPGRLQDAGFPSEGFLSFFYFDGSMDGGVEVVGALFGTDEGARVVYTPAGVDVAEMLPPAPLKPYRRVEMVAEPVLTWPTWESPELHTGGRPADGWDELFTALDDVRQSHPGPVHQVGGNPDPVQGPVEVEVAFGRLSSARSIKPNWSDSAVVEDARGWLLLAQFDSDDGAGFMWGDGGVLYFMIRPEDLERKDFAAAGFTWQCT